MWNQVQTAGKSWRFQASETQSDWIHWLREIVRQWKLRFLPLPVSAINKLQIKPARSRWLILARFIFCMSIGWNGVEVHKHAKKDNAMLQPNKLGQ